MKVYYILFLLLVSSSTILLAQTDPAPPAERSIHVCEASWLFWYEYGMNQCGYNSSQARAFADAKRRECYLTINQ